MLLIRCMRYSVQPEIHSLYIVTQVQFFFLADQCSPHQIFLKPDQTSLETPYQVSYYTIVALMTEKNSRQTTKELEHL